MAKTPIIQKASAKVIGKAQTQAAAPSTDSPGKMLPAMTDKKLDARQKAKSNKRKAHGPKLKRTAKTKKQMALIQQAPVPPTGVN